jgi:hypothetical protein
MAIYRQLNIALLTHDELGKHDGEVVYAHDRATCDLSATSICQILLRAEYISCRVAPR